jgi:hypothetical protein
MFNSLSEVNKVIGFVIAMKWETLSQYVSDIKKSAF